MKFMTWFKITFVAGVVLLVAGGVAVVSISQTSAHEELSAQEIAQQTQDTYDALSSYSDVGTVIAEVNGFHKKTEFSVRLLRPDSYRVDWIQTTDGLYTSRGNAWSAGSDNFVILASAGQKATYQPQNAHDLQTAFTVSAEASGLASSTIPRIFYSQDYSEVLGIPASSHYPLEKERDERVGGVDCYVVKSVTGPIQLRSQGALSKDAVKLGKTTRFFIGKQDHLIHQVRTTKVGASFIETHENIELNAAGLAAYFIP